MTILIVGATGQVARPVVRQLAGMGISTRSLVRNRSKAAGMLTWPGDIIGTELVELQPNSSTAIEQAFDGVDRVLLSMGLLSAEERAVQRHVIDVAARSSLRQLVRVAVLSTSPHSKGLVQRLHADLEGYLADSGVPHTSLRPAVFQSTLLTYAPEIRRDNGWVGSAPTGRNAFIHPEDVSDAAIGALLTSAHQNKTHDLTGPELFSYPDVAGILASELRRPITYMALSPEQHRTTLTQRGVSPLLIDLLLSRDAACQASENDRITTDVETLSGHSPRRLAAYFHHKRSEFIELSSSADEMAT